MTHPVMKKMCQGCPFDVGHPSTEMAYNLGCLPGIAEIISTCNDFNTAWACHSSRTAVCAGYAEAFPDQVTRDLELQEGIHF